MKQKIIAAIKAKFPAVNLTPKRLDEIAAKLEKKVTDESQIDAQIDAFNDFNPIADIGRNDDKLRDLEIKLKKQASSSTQQNQDNEDEDEEEEEEESVSVKKKTEAKKPSGRMPKWAEGLVAEVKALRTEKVQGSIRDKVKTQLGKDVPERFWSKWALPEKEEDVDTFVQEIKDEHTAIEQERVNKNLDGNTPPVGGSGTGTGTQSATVIKADISEWANRGKQKDAAKAATGK